MATDKRFPYNLAVNKDYGPAISVQLPTTSASNEQVTTFFPTQTQDSSNSLNSVPGVQVRNSAHLINSNNYNRNLRNQCYPQISATRSLLLAEQHAFASTSSDSDGAPTPPPNYHEIPGIVPSYQGRTSGPPPSYDDVVNPNAPPPSYQSLFGQVREARKTSNGLVDLFRQLFLILIGTLGCTMIIGFLLLIPITMILVGIVYVNDCRAENIPSFLVIGGVVWIVKNILNCYNQFKKDSTTANRPPPRRVSQNTNSSGSSYRPDPGTTISGRTAVNLSDINNNDTSPAMVNNNNSATEAVNTESSSPTRSTRVSSNYRDGQPVNRIRHPSMIGLTSYKCESMLNYFLVVWFTAGCIVVYRIYEPDYENPLSASYCNRTVYLYAFWLMTSAFIIMAVVLSCLCCLMASSLMSCGQGRS